MAPSHKPWQQQPHRQYRFVNARIVDTKDAKVYQYCAIDIADGVIKRLARHEDASKVDAEMLKWSMAEKVIVVDLEGKYVMPGLIDCHVHLAMTPGEATLQETLAQDASTILVRQPWLLKQILHRGFTSIRDCGGAGRPLQQAIEEGLVEGPRLFIAGHAISQTGGHGDVRTASADHAVNNIGRIADGPGQCLVAAREELRQGADFLKIVVSGGVISPADRLTDLQYTAQEISAFTQAAADAGTYVTAHAYTPAAIQRAIANGAKGIEHGNFLDKSTAALMAQKGVYLTPTLITYKAMASNDFPGFLPPAIAAKNAAVGQAGFESVQVAADAGVTMVFGTDLVGPLQVRQSEEFSLLKQAGQSPAQILQAATVNAAQLLRCDSKIGRIKEGYLADMLVLDVSPLDNIEVLAHPDNHMLVIMKAGRIVKSQLKALPTESI